MQDEFAGRWKTRTVVCIASGPSLSAEDVELVRAAGHPCVVTNTTFRLCPWADVLFAFDSRWWDVYAKEVAATFRGVKVGWSAHSKIHGVLPLANERWFSNFHNSGAGAITIAVYGEAARVLLLGYDCQKTGGAMHWHGDHPKPLGNCLSMKNWPTHFKGVSRFATAHGVPVLNCSRSTALDFFPRARLEDVI